MRCHPSTHPVHWAGFDVAKLSFSAALWGHETFPEMRVRTFARTRTEAPAVLAWLWDSAPPGARLGVIMEAMGSYAEELAGWLLDLDPTLHIAIANPAHTSAFLKSLGLRNKTDDLDAKALAKFGHERTPTPWERPATEASVLKDLVRTRMDLVESRTAMTLRRNDHLRASTAATQALEQVIHALTIQVKALEAAIEAHLAQHETLGSQAKRLMSINGVGLITAVTVLSELGDLRRFARSRHLTAFAGVSPRMRQSGTSVRGRTHMCKQGSARLRSVLYMAASAAARFNPDLHEFYERLLAQGKPRRSALGAIMRKLLVLMRAVLIADQDWVPQEKVA